MDKHESAVAIEGFLSKIGSGMLNLGKKAGDSMIDAMVANQMRYDEEQRQAQWERNAPIREMRKQYGKMEPHLKPIVKKLLTEVERECRKLPTYTAPKGKYGEDVCDEIDAACQKIDIGFRKAFVSVPSFTTLCEKIAELSEEIPNLPTDPEVIRRKMVKSYTRVNPETGDNYQNRYDELRIYFQAVGDAPLEGSSLYDMIGDSFARVISSKLKGVPEADSMSESDFACVWVYIEDFLEEEY